MLAVVAVVDQAMVAVYQAVPAEPMVADLVVHLVVHHLQEAAVVVVGGVE
jgi:hypothetical protein